jgi:hypothetical protein
MRLGLQTGVVIGVVVLSLAVAARSFANETDNFTCHSRSLQDSLGALDALMNATIHEAIGRANARSGACDPSCLVRELEKSVGATARNPFTGIGHARLARVIERAPDIDRCHLKFKESIYGARPYNRPWLVVFNGRIIFLADSIRLAGRVVGIDKINHFVREGLAHWRVVHEDGVRIESVMVHELGAPGWQLRLNENGLKGMTLTGVRSYADLAASYSGFRFWSNLLTTDMPESFITRDVTTGRLAQRRTFSFSSYVNDAWDETINRSTFHPVLAKQVATALRDRSVDAANESCRLLTRLPDSHLYLNPWCFGAEAERR